MYRQPSKRRQLIMRLATYGFMSVAVVVLVTILVFVMLGYRYEGDGHIAQGGLVQFDSQPNSAQVTIDGMVFGANTPSKTTLNAGSHTVSYTLSGYDEWQKTVNLTPGAVLWLNYARLIPKHLSSQNVANFSAVSGALASPDHKTMAIVEEASAPVIRLADVSSDTVTVASLNLPDGSYTAPDSGKTQSFTLEEWDPGSRYLLIKHAYNDADTEWLLVDTQDAAAKKNISKILDVQASKVIFSGNNSQVLYGLTGTDIRRIDMGATTLSGPLVTHAADFSLFDQTTLVYTTVYDPTTGTRTVGYYTDGDQQPTPMRTVKDDGTPSLHLAIGRYFGDMYEAVDYNGTVTITTGDLPTTSNPSPKLQTVATVSVPGGVQYLSIKTEGRFVIMQNQTSFTTYDLELKKVTTTPLKVAEPSPRELGWIDGYMPWNDDGGTVRLYEFDGANQHDIMPVVEGMDVDLSQNSKYLYGIDMSDGAYHLERVQLILN